MPVTSSFQKLSEKTVIPLALLLCYGPYGWVFFLTENRWAWIKLLPLLPGLTTTLLVHAGLRRLQVLPGQWPLIPIGGAVSIALFAAILFFLFRFPRRRLVTIAVALALSSILSYFSYQIYRA